MLKMLDKIIENRWYTKLVKEVNAFYADTYFIQKPFNRLTENTAKDVLADIEYAIGIEMANGYDVQKLQNLYNKIKML